MSLFSTIAPVYNLFYKAQKRAFQNAIQSYELLSLDEKYMVVDLGCGTGALVSVLSELGHSVIGVDNSEKMIEFAQKNNRNSSIKFKVLDITKPLPFLDKSVDVLFISFVLHGLSSDQRKEIYTEMKRVTKRKIVIHEYGKDKDWIHTLAEWLERGDYFQFIKVFESELNTNYSDFKMIETNKIGKWYVVDCDSVQSRIADT